MPEEKPNTAPPSPQIDSDKLIKGAIEAERRASVAESRANQAENIARQAVDAARRATAPQPRPEMDAISRLADEDVTLMPDQRKELLSRAINERASAMAGKAVEQMRRESAMREQALENKLALEGVMNQRPELSEPGPASDFAAAMTKAKFELDASGAQYTSAQLANRAASVYDKSFRKVEAPPFVEGSGQPNLQGTPGQAPQPAPMQSMLETTYGITAGKIEPLYDPKDPEAIRSLNNNYVESRNKQMLERGVVTNLTEIIRAGT